MQILQNEVASGYGTAGLDTLNNMIWALRHHHIRLAFDAQSRTFTLLGSSGLQSDQCRRILHTISYGTWKPVVLNQRDVLGDLTVQFVPLDYGDADSSDGEEGGTDSGLPNPSGESYLDAYKKVEEVTEPLMKTKRGHRIQKRGEA